MKYGKKYAESIKAFDRTKQYDAEEAMDIVINNAKAKFDETVEFHCRLAVPSRTIWRRPLWSANLRA